MKTTLTGFFAGLALIAGELNDHFDSDPKTVFSLDAYNLASAEYSVNPV
jgi:hypothetical protein